MRLLAVMTRYGQTLKDRNYRSNALIWMVQGFVVFTYLTAAPFLFESVYAFTPFQYGVLFGVMAVCMIGSSQINAWLLNYYHSRTLLRAGLAISCFGAFVLLGLAVWSALDVDAAGHLKHVYLWPLFGAMLCALGPGGCIGPNAMAGALLTQGRNAGVATALAGTGQYVFGILASVMFSWLPVGTAIPMGGMLLAAFLVMVVFARPADHALPEGPPDRPPRPALPPSGQHRASLPAGDACQTRPSAAPEPSGPADCPVPPETEEEPAPPPVHLPEPVRSEEEPQEPSPSPAAMPP